MFRTICLATLFSFFLIFIQSENSFAQRKVKTVKVKTAGKQTLDEGDQHFAVSKQGKSKNDKITKNGRRLGNWKESKASSKKQKKRNKQLKRRRGNSSKKYTAGANPQTSEAKKFNKKGKKERNNQRKKERNAAKSRKATMKFNKKLSRQ